MKFFINGSYIKALLSSRTVVQTRTFAKMVIAKKFVYVKPYEGMPTHENVKIVEEDLPPLKDGEFLTEAVYISVDPYMRAYARNYKLGDTLIGQQIAKIIESKNKNHPVGKYVASQFGWRTHTISDGTEEGYLAMPFYTIPDNTEFPLSLYLGVLGMPGNTSYFGFLEICKPKAGETVVVTGAAGAVGSHVGQIAKIKGLTVIGIAGSDKKREWLKSIGFDSVINYKTQDVAVALKEAAPKGVDCYFDNVGGEISSIILNHMNLNGRISVCGAISGYNSKAVPKASIVQYSLVFKQLQMYGFIVSKWADRWVEGIEQNAKWIKEGKLVYKETITDGFENTLDALVGVLNGENTGKAIVKV